MILNRFEWPILQYLLLTWSLAQGLSTTGSIGLGLIFAAFNFYLFLRYYSKINLKKLGHLYYSILALFLCLLLSILINWSEHAEATRGLSKLKYFLIFLIPFPVLLNAQIPLKSWQGLCKKLVLFLTTSYLLATFAGLISRFLGFQVNHWISGYNGRNPGMTGIMQYAYETPLILVIAIYFGFFDKSLNLTRHHKLYLKSCIFIMIFGLLSSNGRGPIVALLLIGLSMGLIFRTPILKSLNLRNGFTYGTIFFALIYISFSNHFIRQEDNRIISSSASLSNDIRFNLNILSINAFANRPIFGYGLLNPKHEIQNEHSKANHYYLQDTHNTHTQILVDGGIISFFFYGFFYFLLVLQLLKSKFYAAKAFAALWLTFLGIATFHSMLVTGTGTAVFLFLLILASCLIVQSKWDKNHPRTRGIL